jgi:hypothetical protein
MLIQMKKIQDAEDNWTCGPDAKIRLNLSSELCDHCRYIDLETPLSSLYNPKENCDLCQILSKVPEEARKIPLLEARQYIRICNVPGL